MSIQLRKPHFLRAGTHSLGLIATDVRAGLHAIGEVTGENVDEAVRLVVLLLRQEVTKPVFCARQKRFHRKGHYKHEDDHRDYRECVNHVYTPVRII